MYAAIIANLFPIYALGCLLAVALNITKLKELSLAFGYGYLLITFQLIFGGRASEFGAKMYVLCSLAQLFIIVTAYLLETRASKIIVFTGIVAVLLNSMEMVLYLSGHPIREAYFIGINIVQTVQIGSLLALSAPGMFLWRLMERKRQKETPWTHQRAATSGIQ